MSKSIWLVLAAVSGVALWILGGAIFLHEIDAARAIENVQDLGWLILR